MVPIFTSALLGISALSPAAAPLRQEPPAPTTLKLDRKAMGETTMTATDRYLFVLRGNTIYQFTVDGLKFLTKTDLPTDPAPPPP
jgi:hypothetical protein